MKNKMKQINIVDYTEEKKIEVRVLLLQKK